MTSRPLASLFLSVLIQLAPLLRVAMADAAVLASPVVAVLRWVIGAVAVAGSFHAVSGATGITITQGTSTTSSPKGTNGTPMGFRVSITSTDHGTAKSYSASGLPPGLAVVSITQGVISGTPAQAGMFTASIRGWQNSNQTGDSASFSVPITILTAAGPPGLASPVSDAVAAYGEPATLTVNASGAAPLSYEWRRGGQLIPNAGTDAFSLAAATPDDYGSYEVRISNSFGSTNVTVRLLYPTALIHRGSLWRYLDSGVEPSTDWTQATFDDSSWKSGPAQLGYGDGDEATMVSFGGNASAKFISTYFRHALQRSITPEAFAALRLSLLRDDGAVVYLNGQEVRRDNLPSGTVTATTPATGTVDGADESLFTTTHLDIPLSSGANLIAVEIHQSSPASSDLSFDLELTALARGGPPVVSTSPTSQTVNAGGTVELTAGAAGLQPMVVRWFHGETELADAHEPTLLISGASAADAGEYWAVFVNAVGEAATARATLSVNPGGSHEPPVIYLRHDDGSLWLEFVGEAGVEYVVERAAAPTGPWSLLQTLRADTQTTQRLPLSLPETEQYFRVRVAP